VGYLDLRDPGLRGCQIGLGAGNQDDVHTLLRQAFRAGQPDALGCAGDQRGASA
jgi:hypothetical protein